MGDADVAFNGRDSNEGGGLGQPASSSAVPAVGARTEQPERELKSENPNLTAAAPPGTKKGVVDKVKDLFEGVKKGYQNKTGSGAVESGVEHSPDSTSHGTAADNQEFSGHDLDPTAAPAEKNFKSKVVGSPGPWPHPTNPRHPRAEGTAAPTGEHGILHPGPEEDGVKKEGFLSKIKDKLHGPKSPKSNQ